eukprot:363906-Chlamydomonas_euryale.AAC.2
MHIDWAPGLHPGPPSYRLASQPARQLAGLPVCLPTRLDGPRGSFGAFSYRGMHIDRPACCLPACKCRLPMCLVIVLHSWLYCPVLPVHTVPPLHVIGTAGSCGEGAAAFARPPSAPAEGPVLGPWLVANDFALSVCPASEVRMTGWTGCPH